MSEIFLLSPAQMRRITPFFPRWRGIPPADDRRVIGGIGFVIRNGLRWRAAPAAYGAPRPYTNASCAEASANARRAASRLGVFAGIFAALAGKAGTPERLMLDTTHLKAHRTAASLAKKGRRRDVSGAPRAA